MKKTYLFPEAKVKDLYFDQCFLASLGGASGEDLSDPDDVDPWS